MTHTGYKLLRSRNCSFVIYTSNEIYNIVTSPRMSQGLGNGKNSNLNSLKRFSSQVRTESEIGLHRRGKPHGTLPNSRCQVGSWPSREASEHPKKRGPMMAGECVATGEPHVMWNGQAEGGTLVRVLMGSWVSWQVWRRLGASEKRIMTHSYTGPLTFNLTMAAIKRPPCTLSLTRVTLPGAKASTCTLLREAMKSNEACRADVRRVSKQTVY